MLPANINSKSGLGKVRKGHNSLISPLSVRLFPRNPPPRVISYRKGRDLWEKKHFPAIYPWSKNIFLVILPIHFNLSLAEYNFSENRGRKYPFMVCFGWIYAYIGTDLVFYTCVYACVCVCTHGVFAAAERNQDFRVNGQDDCRLLYVSTSVTRAAHRSRSPGQTMQKQTRPRYKRGVIAASCLWLICGVAH